MSTEERDGGGHRRTTERSTATGSRNGVPEPRHRSRSDGFEPDADGRADALERAGGNMAVGSLLGTGAARTTEPSDTVETEARRVAAGGKLDASGVQRRPSPAGLDRLARELGTAPGGRRLHDGTRTELESRFDTELGNVRLHDGPVAASVTESLDATAVTAGEHVYDGRGGSTALATATDPLLTHELAHVVQFRTGRLSRVARQTADAPTAGSTDEWTEERLAALVRRQFEQSLLTVLRDWGSDSPAQDRFLGVDRLLSTLEPSLTAKLPPRATQRVSDRLDALAFVEGSVGELTLDVFSAAELLSWYLGAPPGLNAPAPTSYGVGLYVRLVAEDIAAFLAPALDAQAEPFRGQGFDALQSEFQSLLDGWQDPSTILELELEGTLREMAARREQETEDERAGVERLARRALLLHDSIEELRRVGDVDRDRAAMDEALARTVPDPATIRQRLNAPLGRAGARSRSESATLDALGGGLHLLGIHGDLLARDPRGESPVDTSIVPETAFPETTTEAVDRMRSSLKERLSELNTVVERRHDAVLPSHSERSYTLTEFARVYRNWLAFFGPAAREEWAPFKQLDRLFQGLGEAAGLAGGFEGGMLRYYTQGLVADSLPLPGASADFASELEAPTLTSETGGSAAAPLYRFGALFDGVASLSTRGETWSRTRQRRGRTIEQARAFEDVRQRPAGMSPARAARGYGLTSPDEPLGSVTLDEPSDRESNAPPSLAAVGSGKGTDWTPEPANRRRWRYLLSQTVRTGPGERRTIYEERGMPQDVAEYLLAERQLAAAYSGRHVPQATRRTESGKEQVPIGTRAVRTQGLLPPTGRSAAATRPIQAKTEALLSDLETYLDTFFANGTGAERVAATYLVASGEYRGTERFAAQFDLSAIAGAVAQALGLATVLAAIRRVGGPLGRALSRGLSSLLEYMGIRGDAATLIAIANWFQRTSEVESFTGARRMGYIASDLLEEIGSLIVGMAADVGVDFATSGTKLETQSTDTVGLLSGLTPVIGPEIGRYFILQSVRSERTRLESEQQSVPGLTELRQFEYAVETRFGGTDSTGGARTTDRTSTGVGDSTRTDVEEPGRDIPSREAPGRDTPSRDRGGDGGGPGRSSDSGSDGERIPGFDALLNRWGLFKDERLRTDYWDYRRRKQAAGEEPAQREEWALRQSTGRPRRIFEELFGPDYARGKRTGYGRGSKNIIQGYLGELFAQHVLFSQGHDILLSNTRLAQTTQSGFDFVTMKDGELYVIDNKAESGSGNVSGATALTDNYQQNIVEARSELWALANDAEVPAATREKAKAAVAAIDRGEVRKAITAAHVGDPDELRSGVTSTLESADIEFIDVLRTESSYDEMLGPLRNWVSEQ